MKTIDSSQRASIDSVLTPITSADIDKLRVGGFQAALLDWVSDYPQREILFGLARKWRPIFKLFGMTVVTRYDHVREVLGRDVEFPVPWAGRMVEITGGRNFVLGMADGADYRLSYEQIARAWRREDIGDHVVPISAHVSDDILKRHAHGIDAIAELVRVVPAYITERYYGIGVPDKKLFSACTMAMSSYIFGPPHSQPSADSREVALKAAAYFMALVRNAISEAKTRVHSGGHCGCQQGVVLQRLIAMQSENPAALPDAAIEAHLFGMVTGLIPTNTLAAGNMVDTLLRRKKFMTQARAAALRDDDELLWRCLREALRFRNINLGAFRKCGGKPYTLAAGTRHARTIQPEDTLLVSIQMAMFDPLKVKHPHRFDASRPADDYLMFGSGQHWCVGAYIAIAQITQMMKALLRKPGLRRAPGRRGKMRRMTVFPESLCVEYDA